MSILRSVWGVEAQRRRDPRTGATYLLPYRPTDPAPPYPPGSRGRIHVIGGGGAAAPILRELVDAGWSVSAGILPLLDTDAEASEELGVPFVAEIPFAPIGEEARARLREQLADARAIVVAPIAVGPSNLANLEELKGRAGRVPVLFVETDAFATRDFTGGVAAGVRAELLGDGAEVVPGADALLRRLATLPEIGPALTPAT